MNILNRCHIGLIVTTWVFFLAGVNTVKAQRTTVVTGHEYLSFNQTYQLIYLRQIISGRVGSLVEDCASDLTQTELTVSLSQWLRENPRNLNLPANLALTRFLIARCKEKVLPSDELTLPDKSSLDESIFSLSPAKNEQQLTWKVKDEKLTNDNLEYTSNIFSPKFTVAIASNSLFGSTVGQFEDDIDEQKEHSSPEQPAEDSGEEESQPGFPLLQGVLKLQILNFNIFEATSSENKLNDLFTDNILNTNLFVNDEIYFNAAWRFLPSVFPPNPRRDRYFEDNFLITGALNLNYETDNFYLAIGKGTTNFSVAFRSAPGVFGRDVAERDIRVPVRVGISVGGTFDAGSAGNYSLTGTAFFLDTSFLNKPIFRAADPPRVENGGPSNTESLESFLISLDATNFEALPGLSTHIAFMRQKVDRIKPPGSPIPLPNELIDDEYRFVAAALWPIKVNEDLQVTPLIEYARFWNGSGIKNQYRDYLTTSVQIFTGKWNTAIASTIWFIDNPNGPNANNIQFQVSGGYLFDIGLGVDLGYRFLEVENEGTHTLGLWLNYTFGF